MATGQRKRTIYQAQINNAQSIKADETLVSVLLKRVTRDVTKSGNNPGTPYYKLVAIKLGNDPVFVKMRVKKKKQKTDENGDSVDTSEETEDDGQPKGTTLNGADEFLVTTYDRNASTLTGGMMVKLALTTDIYQDRFTYQAGSVIVERSSNILCDSGYIDNVKGTKLAVIPTVDNMSRDDFEEGTDEKYMNRVFVLPVSPENPTFSNVEIQIDDDATGIFFTKKKDDPEQYVGINTQLGDKTANMFRVVYTPSEEDQANGANKTLITFAYMPEAWQCFGCANVDLWAKVAKVLIFNAVEWYVYGYSNLLKLESLLANKSHDDNDDFDYSTGFVTRMNVNLPATVKKVGVPLSHGFIEDHFGSESNYQNDHEYETHPINSGWKVNARRDKPYCINFTDLSRDQTESFIKEIKKNSSNVQFYGLFEDNRAYEFVSNSPEEYEEKIVETGLVPDMVFAVNRM